MVKTLKKIDLNSKKAKNHLYSHQKKLQSKSSKPSGVSDEVPPTSQSRAFADPTVSKQGGRTPQFFMSLEDLR